MNAGGTNPNSRAKLSSLSRAASRQHGLWQGKADTIQGIPRYQRPIFLYIVSATAGIDRPPAFLTRRCYMGGAPIIIPLVALLIPVVFILGAQSHARSDRGKFAKVAVAS